MIGENLKKQTPKSEALEQSPLALARQHLKTHLENGKIIKEMQMARTTEPKEGPFSDHLTLKTAFFGILFNAETIRKSKGRGRGKGRGKGSYPGGSAVGSTNAEDHLYSKKVEVGRGPASGVPFLSCRQH